MDSPHLLSLAGEAPDAHYLLVKRGLYYGPNNAGYTGFKERAGRYPASDADEASGVTAVHEDEADEIAPKCFDDLARDYLNGKITGLRKTNASLLAALKVADEAIKEMFRYYDGGETRGSYDGKPERAGLRKAGYATAAALRALSQSHSQTERGEA